MSGHVSSQTMINWSGNMRLPAQGERRTLIFFSGLSLSNCLGTRSKVPHCERRDTEISTHFSAGGQPGGQPHVGIIPGAHNGLNGEAGAGDMNNTNKDAEWFV